jgi:hypothetical protein
MGLSFLQGLRWFVCDQPLHKTILFSGTVVDRDLCQAGILSQGAQFISVPGAGERANE